MKNTQRNLFWYFSFFFSEKGKRNKLKNLRENPEKSLFHPLPKRIKIVKKVKKRDEEEEKEEIPFPSLIFFINIMYSF